MSVLGWMAVTGALLLFMALTSANVKRLPISTACIYLVVGVIVGPLGFGLLRVDLGAQHWLETVTQFAVIVSLFVGGLRLRLPLRHATWRRAALLAGPVMLLSILGVAAVGHFALGLPVFAALLVGAILSPTDPVLATAVSVNDAEDHDLVRFSLSGEAGLNDGMAFPFVVFALEGLREGGALGSWVAPWFASRLLWAVPAGLLIGYPMGLLVGRFAIKLRSRERDLSAPSDFLALALIALSYVAAEFVDAWGFLSVFAAGVGLRNAEVSVVGAAPHPASRPAPEPPNGAVAHPPAETLVHGELEEKHLEEPSVAAGVLVSEAITFGHTLERLLEVLLVVLVGAALASSWWTPALLLAAALLLVIRPVATVMTLRLRGLSRGQRFLIGWFGIRGIGSLYYLGYALNHGVDPALAGTIGNVVVSVVACSIVAHGITVTPLLARYERALRAGAHPS